MAPEALHAGASAALTFAGRGSRTVQQAGTLAIHSLLNVRTLLVVTL